MRALKIHHIPIFIFSILLFISQKVSAQASWEQFGQNRVQYNVFNWNYFDSTHFRCFYYDKGKENAIYALHIAEQEINHIVNMMGGHLPRKINLVLYNSFTEFKQTNLGRKNNEINEAGGGKVEILGENIPIYFSGDHNDLKKQIRKGVSELMKNRMLFGTNIKEVVKNSVKMNLPEWFTIGYIQYLSDEWTAQNQIELETLLKNSKHQRFEEVSLLNPKLVGFSFWKYIADQYGENDISNILYLTRFRKTVNASLESILKKNSKEVFREWEQYYNQSESNFLFDTLSKKNNRTLLTKIKQKPQGTYSKITMSPTGKDIAYVEHRDGKYHVYVQDTKTERREEIIDGGNEGLIDNKDPDYPHLAWSPSGNLLAIVYQVNNKLKLKVLYSHRRKQENKMIRFRYIERITGLCFMGDETNLAITGIKKGQSDLFQMNIKTTRVTNITNDLFDDKSPMYIQNGTETGILFLSNRNSPYIGENAKSNDFTPYFNLFLYQFSTGTNLVPLSSAKTVIEYPMQWGQDGFAYLIHDGKNIRREQVKISKRAPLTDTFEILKTKPLPFVTLKQEYTSINSKVLELQYTPKEILVYATPHIVLKEENEKYLLEEDTLQASTIQEENVNDTKKNLITYQTPFDEDTSTISFFENAFALKHKKKERYQLFTDTILKIKPKKYITNFYPDFIQTSIDNTLFFNRYQPFGYYGTQFQNQSLSGFLSSSLIDIMEDYKLEAGVRLAPNFRSLDYFLQYNNYKHRSDFSILYYHSVNSNNYNFSRGIAPNFSPYPVLGKVTFDYLQGTWTYPFSTAQRVSLYLGARLDKILFKAQEHYSIGIESDKKYWAFSKAEYVFDNTSKPYLNISKGGKAKIFFEYFLKLTGKTEGFYTLGYDARKYITIYKNVIFASRLAGAHSFGNAKILYFLGGVDNDFYPRFDSTTLIDYSQNYAFQTLATNVRGYLQGTRNGNSYILFNEELRMPILNTLFNKKSKSNFLNSLQLVAFTDLGSAWRGVIPNSENMHSPVILQSGNVTLYLNDTKQDIAVGYGFGIRSTLLGYFIRTDLAWSAERKKRPMLHVSMAYDF
ncbi:MAG: hypothetical protein R2831_08815 [Chitinophagaceae bacterium]